MRWSGARDRRHAHRPAANQTAPIDIAVDDTSVYWLESSGHILKLTPK